MRSFCTNLWQISKKQGVLLELLSNTRIKKLNRSFVLDVERACIRAY